MEQVEVLFENEKTRIEKIFSFGEASPENFYYDQSEAEFVMLLKGRAELEVEGDLLRLKKGESFYIAPHVRHRVTRTGKNCVWLCVFLKEG